MGWLFLFLAVPIEAQEGFPRFRDVASDVGVSTINVAGGPTKDYIVESTGNGAAFFDYDNDGDADLLITNGSTLDRVASGGDPVAVLYRNDDGRFTDTTEAAGINARGWAMGVCAGDFDNDGHTDFYITAYGPNLLYRNRGNGTFSEVPASGTADAGWGTNCAFGDYDRDGFVDLYVANYVAFSEATVPGRHDDECGYMGAMVFCGPQGLAGAPDVLYRNNGDGTFSDVSERSGIAGPAYYGFGVIFSDFDNDGWPDIYVANDGVPNLLFHNNRDGTFREIGLLSGTAMNDNGNPQSGMGVDVGDYDGDGDTDIMVTNFSGDRNTLYQNLGKMFFVDVTASAHLAEASRRNLGWGVDFADLDNDGLLDIFVANGHIYPEIDALDAGQSYRQPKELYRNLGDGTFQGVTAAAGPDLSRGHPARGLATSDYDNDGDVDVIVVNMNEPPSLYRNEGDNRRSWIGIRLEGTTSNRDAIGSRIRIDVGGVRQTREVRSGGSYLSHNDMRLHFGLGDATRIDRIEIRWPNGRMEQVRNVDANQYVTIREGSGLVSGSRP